MRGDSNGRVPFSLVAVLLLLSAGVSAMHAAKFAHDEASQRLREAQLAALGEVADAVHGEVVAQAQYLAVEAIRRGTEGLVNETKIRLVFRETFADYLGSHFPRVIRSVTVSIPDSGGDLRLASRRLMDIAPPDATQLDFVDGKTIETPDPTVPDAWVELDRLAYFSVYGFVNYTLSIAGVTLERWAPLQTIVPVPAPLMEAKVEQLARTGIGDVTGVGRTVKAILATVTQFRVLDGFASAARPGTTTADVLTAQDVELAVNLAVLLEEIRSFRAYDPDAAAAIDVAHGSGRPLTGLLQEYAARGSLDAADLYALYVGLDARGLHMGAILAQAIAALADDAVLKHLDYLGLTSFADWLTKTVEGVAKTFDGFIDWLFDNPPEEVTFILEYLKTLFGDSGTPTTYLGPTAVSLPDRAYEVPNGSSSIRISIPAHAFTVPFATRDLLSRSLDDFWIAYYPTFANDTRGIHEGIRDLANDVAANLGRDAVLAGLLADTASGPVDPKDEVSFLAAVSARVEDAVDRAADWFRSDPRAVDSLMGNLWNAAKTTIARLVDHLVASYAKLAGESSEISNGEAALVDDLYADAAGDSDFAKLSDAQRSALRTMMRDDVFTGGWVSVAFSDVRGEDVGRWREALAATNDTALPGSKALRDQLREAAIGAGGWLLLARDTIHRMMRESAEGIAVASAEAAVTTNLGAFELWDPRDPERRSLERFRVRHLPSLLRQGADQRSDGLWVEVVDPKAIPRTPDTPNVHYTRPFERSARPFATRWTVHVLGSLTVRAETERAVLIGPNGLEPAVVEATWPLDFTIAVDVYSGWNLTGVAYHNSNDLLGDAWQTLLSFLDVAWEALSEAASWVLDVLRAVVRVLMELIEPIITFVHKVVEILTEALRMIVDLLYEIAVGAIQAVLSAVDEAVDLFPNTTFEVTGYGMDWRFAINAADGRELELTVGTDALEVGVAFVDFAEMGTPADLRYDVLGWWTVSLGPYHLDAGIDPLRLVQDYVLEGRAEWDSWWTMGLEGLVLESYLDYSVSIPLGWIPIPPFGDVEIEVGFEILITANPLPIVFDLLENTIAQAFEDVGGIALSLEYVIRFSESLLRHFSENVLAVVEQHGDNLLEVSVYLEGEFDFVTASPLGAGFRLSFVADGMALAGIIAWIAANVAAYLRALLNPLTPIEFQGLSVNLLEHLFIRGEVHVSIEAPLLVRPALEAIGLDLTFRVAALIEANLALIGSLIGQDWGTWEVNFGVYVELPEPLGQIFGGPMGWGGNLWFLRGSFHPY